MSFSSGEDVSRTIEFDDDVSFGDVSCLPISMDGNASDTDIRSSDSEPGQEVDDAQRMACASRIVSHYLLSKARAGLLNAGVIGEDVAKYSFAQVQAALESEAAQSAARLVLRAIGIHQGERPLTPRQAAKEQADCRILLSSLLFALHPHAVMEEKEPRVPSSGTHITQETMTLYCARRMLLCLHVGTLKAITSSWVMWRTAFLSWKKKDAESLLRAMIEDAVAADSMRIAVNRGFSQSANVQALRNVLGGREADFSPARSEHVAWEEQISQKQIEIREAIVRFAGEAGAKRLDAALTTSTHARNERMVHEILVDLPGLLHSIREERPVPEEIWERLRSQLSAQPPVRDELASRLASISQALNTLMPGSFNLNADEGPVELDVDFAVDIVIKAADSLKKSQAAAMDDALEQWLHDVLYQLQSAGSRLVHVIVDVLQQLTDLVRGVQTDVLMYRVKHSAPIVQQYGEVWARSHFESHIASGKFSDGLPWTKKLLSETLITSEQDENSGHVNMEEHSASSIRLLLTQSLVRMVTSLSICPPECMPEVFYLDHERIVKLQNDVQTCTVVSSLDNIGRQFLQSKGMPGSSSRLQQLSDIAQREDIRMEDIQETFVEWVRSESIRFGSTVTEEEVMLLQGMVKRISSPDDRTFSLMHRRVGQAIVELCSHIGSHLSGANSMERPHHGLMGLEAVDDILLAVAKRVYALVSHVSAVHGESITHILKSL